MSTRILAGRYEMVEKIGEGGMAVVFKGRDRLLNRYVAVKILRPEFTTDEVFIESFRRESQMAANLIHPNIVNIFDVGTEGNIYYIVMELIEGRTLSDIIRQDGPLDPQRAVSIARQIASALSLAHKSGLIHRDVKPHNIMITAAGTAKITDFGIAKTVSQDTFIEDGKHESVMGSVHYFSPEQARGGHVTEASDVYSLGIVLYEMLTGQVPFDGETAVEVAVKHMNEPMQPPTRINPEIPQDLEDIILKATDKVPVNRYQSMDDMILALNFVRYNRAAHHGEEDGVRSAAGAAEGAAAGVAAAAQDEDDLEERRERRRAARDRKKGRVKGGEAAEGAEPEEKKTFAHPQRYLAVLLAVLLAIPTSAWIFGKLHKEVEEQEILPPATQEIELPSVVGTQLETAKKELAKKGISIEVEMQIASNTYEAGIIMSQSPNAGAKVKEGATLRVNVSKGKPDGKVPSVTGKSFNDAKYQLEAYGYDLGSRTETYSESVPKGYVMSQNPAAGTSLAAGSKVNLVVSLGKEQTEDELTINVVSYALEDATDFIGRMGCTVGAITYSSSATVPKNHVIKQNPSPTAALHEGDAIDLEVSLGNGSSSGEEPGPDDPTVVEEGQVEIYISYAASPSEEFLLTVNATDEVSGARTVIRQATRYRANGGETIVVPGAGSDGRVLIFFGNNLMYEFTADFVNGVTNEVLSPPPVVTPIENSGEGSGETSGEGSGETSGEGSGETSGEGSGEGAGQ